ncbi:MAG: TrkH family potassium uptake protein [Phycisphaerae bacterium]|jgi:trk system potassium uptake protein|nr:TrkH family potassium uptake protein [Phycisphaerae bacterium]MBT5366340.1 TrkH family potassium uptake protein [Phycisphaerae bacterium]MBT6269935.1 TrkH family potassium uptake protein [Phycisphaerae bacterium]
MNYRLIVRQLGLLVLVLSAVLLCIWAWSGFAISFVDKSVFSLLWSTAICVFLGLVLFIFGSKSKNQQGTGSMGRREALLLVSTSWLVGAVVSALPFLIWARSSSDENHPFRSIVNCFFEAMSGLTTTGATILTDISTVPAPLLFWRSMIQWLGGLGIVVLFVAVLPSLGAGGKKLFRVEAPGPEPEGVRPHIRETARILWLIYLCLTIVEIIAYWLAGMTWFDASNHALTTLATGGFSTQNASIGAYNSRTIDIITIVFMVLAGANFGLYYAAVKGKLKIIWSDVEFRFYIFLLTAGSIVVVFSLLGSGQPLLSTTDVAQPLTVGDAVTSGIFEVVSQQTTTGYATSNFDTWPFAAKAVLLLLMFVGGCAGSTGGGIKVIRVWIAFKVMFSELERSFRPHVVRPLKVGKSAIDPELKLATITYVLGILILFAVGSGAIMLFESGNPECTITTAATASIATICTVGPGLAKVGAIENYSWFSDASKLMFCVLMAIGRLEVFAVLVLITPRFWRSA